MNNENSYEILEMKEFPHYPNEIGKQVGYLKILDEIESILEYPIYYMCECKCGKEVIRERRRLLYNQGFKSCGCYRDMVNKLGSKPIKHGRARCKDGKRDKLYRAWVSMRQRCNNPNDTVYKWYGAKGIKVCKEWDDFKIFHKWAMKNGYKKGLTIERKDPTKNYFPDNCAWITKKDQAKNTSRNSYFIIDGERIILQDLANKLNLDRKIVQKMAIDGRLKYDYWNRDPIHKN